MLGALPLWVLGFVLFDYQRMKCWRSFSTKMISSGLEFFPRDDYFC